VCSQSFLGTSLKYHIKTCARTTLAQLATCPHCGRPLKKDDLPEHAKRCKLRRDQGAMVDDQARKAFHERVEVFRATLAKIASGEIGTLDSKGFFMCCVCSKKGLALNQILAHEEACRMRLDREGSVPVAAKLEDDLLAGETGGASRPFVVGIGGVSAGPLAAAVTAIRCEVSVADDSEGILLAMSLDRLREVVMNACHKEEKKYRKIRCSNKSFEEAIGRWPSAVKFLELVGFENVMLSSKGGPPEPHLVVVEQLPEAVLQVALGALDTSLPLPPAATNVAAASAGIAGTCEEHEAMTDPDPCTLLEECQYCHRRFRFDRIAKHETRCMAARPMQSRFDNVRNILGGTVGERNIPSVKRTWQENEGGRVRLPPLGGARATATGYECARCGRFFSADALDKHARVCRVQTAEPRMNPRANDSQSGVAPRQKSSDARPRPRSAGGIGSARGCRRPPSGGQSGRAGMSDQVPAAPVPADVTRASARQASVARTVARRPPPPASSRHASARDGRNGCGGNGTDSVHATAGGPAAAGPAAVAATVASVVATTPGAEAAEAGEQPRGTAVDVVVAAAAVDVPAAAWGAVPPPPPPPPEDILLADAAWAAQTMAASAKLPLASAAATPTSYEDLEVDIEDWLGAED